MAAGNVKAAGNVTVSFGAQVTRNSDGSWSADIPGVNVGIALNSTNFTYMDQGLIASTQNDYDLTASNLDGQGAKDLTGLYVLHIFVPVAGSGSGSFTVSSGTTNPYLGLPLAANGLVLTQTTPFRMAFGDLVVSAGAKTEDWTLSGTLQMWAYIFAGPSRF